MAIEQPVVKAPLSGTAGMRALLAACAGVVLIACGSSSPATVPSAQATPSPIHVTTSFKGTVSPTGTVEFTLSDDANKVTRFYITPVICGFPVGYEAKPGDLGPDPSSFGLSDRAFKITFGGMKYKWEMFITGRLTSATAAEGTFEWTDLRTTVPKACQGHHAVTWTATGV